MNKKFLSVALFGALLALAPGTFTSCKDYDDDIDSVNERVDETQATLNEKANALQAALDAANREIEAAKTAAANAKTAADKAAADATAAIATAKAAAITEAVNQIKALNYASATDVQNVLTKVTALETALGNIKLEDLASKDQVDALEEALDLQAEALKEFVKNTDYAADKAKLQEWIEEINTFKGTVATKEDLEDLAQEISGYNGNLATLNALFDRITSMVFAPSIFVNGIEAIPFITLAYTPWDITEEDPADWYIDQEADEVTIDNGANSAEYFVNPSYIAAENIKLRVLDNLAVNFDMGGIVRAEKEPLFSATVVKVENGKMLVNFAKNVDQSLHIWPNMPDTCLMVALQAEVDSNTFVTSDWARIMEVSTTPYIHNAAVKGAVDTLPYHFWDYEDAVDEDEAILKEVVYTETVDLDSLVTVCAYGSMHNFISDYESYGLSFEFELVEYLLQDDAEEETDQAKFAKIDENNVISSCAYNGTPNNRDALGRQPMIRVKLMHGENVVDVAYFKIMWVEAPVTPTPQKVVDLGTLDMEFNSAKFHCDSSYVGLVGTEEMNRIFAELNMQNIEMPVIYGPFVAFDSAKSGVAIDQTLGTLERIAGEGQSVTYNIRWEVGALEFDEEVYKAGKVTETVYGYFEYKGVRYIFNVTIDLGITEPELVAGYVQTYWNTSDLTAANDKKSFQVNPALTDDEDYGYSSDITTCPIVSDILTAYNEVEGVFVKNAAECAFVFDEDRLAELGFGEEWTVDESGLALMKGEEIAATIDGSEIALYEVEDEATAAAQELLGKSVPVQLVAVPLCMNEDEDGYIFTVELDAFLVNFIRPLAVDLTNVEDSFTDLITEGDTVYVNSIANVKETFGLRRDIIKEGKVVNEDLEAWYAVENVVWDVENAKTNLAEKDGSIVIGEELTSDWADFEELYNVVPVPDADGKVVALVFKNKSGAHIQQAFKIAIPVYVKTKWTPELSDADMKMVVLSINPGDYDE